MGTPEYHGSYSAVLKAILENLEYPSVIQGKPVGLVGVAAGVLGATKSLEHLTSVCNHIGAHVHPKTVSIANIYQAFDKEGNIEDESLRDRLEALVTNTLDYVARFKA